MLDWSDGEYELTAKELDGVARELVERAAIGAGERVLDLGCGTGNAALHAARRGARVTAVDPAERLLGVARDRARAERLEITFVPGAAENVPSDDGAFDVVVSNFALIFANEAERAVAECARVLAPGGRLLVTVWIAEGAFDAAMGIFRRAFQDAMAVPSEARARFLWGDLECVGALLGRHLQDVSMERRGLLLRAPTADAFFDEFFDKHPVGRAGAAALERAGTLLATRARMLEEVRGNNEDRAAFQLTSPYAIVRGVRPNQ